MNTKITKYKNYTSVDLINNRLTRLENLLQRILDVSGNNQKNQSGLLITGEISSKPENIPNILISRQGIARQENFNFNQHLNSLRAVKNSGKNGARDLLLSHGQIIAEIASAIARAGQRNS